MPSHANAAPRTLSSIVPSSSSTQLYKSSHQAAGDAATAVMPAMQHQLALSQREQARLKRAQMRERRRQNAKQEPRASFALMRSESARMFGGSTNSATGGRGGVGLKASFRSSFRSSGGNTTSGSSGVAGGTNNNTDNGGAGGRNNHNHDSSMSSGTVQAMDQSNRSETGGEGGRRRKKNSEMLRGSLSMGGGNKNKNSQMLAGSLRSSGGYGLDQSNRSENGNNNNANRIQKIRESRNNSSSSSNNNNNNNKHHLAGSLVSNNCPNGNGTPNDPNQSMGFVGGVRNVKTKMTDNGGNIRWGPNNSSNNNETCSGGSGNNQRGRSNSNNETNLGASMIGSSFRNSGYISDRGGYISDRSGYNSGDTLIDVRIDVRRSSYQSAGGIGSRNESNRLSSSAHSMGYASSGNENAGSRKGRNRNISRPIRNVRKENDGSWNNSNENMGCSSNNENGASWNSNVNNDRKTTRRMSDRSRLSNSAKSTLLEAGQDTGEPVRNRNRSNHQVGIQGMESSQQRRCARHSSSDDAMRQCSHNGGQNVNVNQAGPLRPAPRNGYDDDDDDDDDNDNEGLLSPEDIEEWHKASTEDNSLSSSLHSLGGDRETDQRRRLSSADKDDQETDSFVAEPIIRPMRRYSSTCTTASGSTAPMGNISSGRGFQDRTLTSSAFTTTTASSDTTRVQDNRSDKKSYYNLSRAAERRQFVDILRGNVPNGGGSAAGSGTSPGGSTNYGNAMGEVIGNGLISKDSATTANSGPTGASVGSGGSVHTLNTNNTNVTLASGDAGGRDSSGERSWGCSIRGHESEDPAFDIVHNEEDDEEMAIQTFKPRRKDGMNKASFASGASSGGSKPKYASMQDILDDDEACGSEAGGGKGGLAGLAAGLCVRCNSALGEKGTKRRKISVVILVKVLVITVMACVAGSLAGRGAEEESGGKPARVAAKPKMGGAPNRAPSRPSAPNEHVPPTVVDRNNATVADEAAVGGVSGIGVSGIAAIQFFPPSPMPAQSLHSATPTVPKIVAASLASPDIAASSPAHQMAPPAFYNDTDRLSHGSTGLPTAVRTGSPTATQSPTQTPLSTCWILGEGIGGQNEGYSLPVSTLDGPDQSREYLCISFCYDCLAYSPGGQLIVEITCTDDQRGDGTRISRNMAIPLERLGYYEDTYSEFGFRSCWTDDCNGADACITFPSAAPSESMVPTMSPMSPTRGPTSRPTNNDEIMPSVSSPITSLPTFGTTDVLVTPPTQPDIGTVTDETNDEDPTGEAVNTTIDDATASSSLKCWISEGEGGYSTTVANHFGPDKEYACVSFCYDCAELSHVNNGEFCTEQQRASGTRLSMHMAMVREGLDSASEDYMDFGFASCATNDCNREDACAARLNDGDVSTLASLDALSAPYVLSHSMESSSTSSRYGCSVAISGDGRLIAVGATEAIDDNGDTTGAVYLYSLDSTSDSDSLSLLQVIHGQSPLGEFGNAIALSHDGHRLVVGSRSEDVGTGAVRVYQRENSGADAPFKIARSSTGSGSAAWALMEGGVIKGQDQQERAGWSVSISPDGSVVAMGSPKGGVGGGGSVLAFKYNDLASGWYPYGPTIQGWTSGGEAGYSISLSDNGSFMAVGSPKASNLDRAANAGRTAVYFMVGSDWQLLGQEIHGEAEGDADGTSVATSKDGSVLVIGGKGHVMTSAGRCRVFHFQADRWQLQHSIVGKSSEERLGSSAAVSPDGNVVACGGVGGAKESDPGRSGAVRIWNRVSMRKSTIWSREGGNDPEGAMFGSSVAISARGERVVVGAPMLSSGAAAAGGTFTGMIELFRDVM